MVIKDDKEKVMDVELNEEYSEGRYGNAKLGGSSTLTRSLMKQLLSKAPASPLPCKRYGILYHRSGDPG